MAFPIQDALRPELTWTHYRLLCKVKNDSARTWYMNESANEHWSSRQLDRQISTLYYERLLASWDKSPVVEEASEKLATVEPVDFIKDPYVLEFLDLEDYPRLRETELEQALIDNLQEFLLELGTGFCFVSRQKCMRYDDEDFNLDLVFYHAVLKCYVIIDLKIGGLSHADVGADGQLYPHVRCAAKARGRQPDHRSDSLLREKRGDSEILVTCGWQADVCVKVSASAAEYR